MGNFTQQKRGVDNLGLELGVTEGKYNNTKDLSTFLEQGINNQGVYGGVGNAGGGAGVAGQQGQSIGAMAGGVGNFGGITAPSRIGSTPGDASSYVNNGAKDISLSGILSGTESTVAEEEDSSAMADSGKKLVKSYASMAKAPTVGGETIYDTKGVPKTEIPFETLKNIKWNVNNFTKQGMDDFAHVVNVIDNAVNVKNSLLDGGGINASRFFTGKDRSKPEYMAELVENGTYDEKTKHKIDEDINDIIKTVKETTGQVLNGSQAAYVLEEARKYEGTLDFIGFNKDKVKAFATDLASGVLSTRQANKQRNIGQLEAVYVGIGQLDKYRLLKEARESKLKNIAKTKGENPERLLAKDTELQTIISKMNKSVNQLEGAFQTLGDNKELGLGIPDVKDNTISNPAAKRAFERRTGYQMSANAWNQFSSAKSYKANEIRVTAPTPKASVSEASQLQRSEDARFINAAKIDNVTSDRNQSLKGLLEKYAPNVSIKYNLDMSDINGKVSDINEKKLGKLIEGWQNNPEASEEDTSKLIEILGEDRFVQLLKDAGTRKMVEEADAAKALKDKTDLEKKMDDWKKFGTLEYYTNGGK